MTSSAAGTSRPRQVLVVGASTGSASLATILASNGVQVLVVEDDEDRIASLSDLLATQLVDDVDIAALDQVGIGDFDLVVLDLQGRFGRTALLAGYASDAGVRRVWATARTPAQSRILHRLAVERVLTPEADAAASYAADALAVQPSWIRLPGDQVLALIPAPADAARRALLAEALARQPQVHAVAVISSGGAASAWAEGQRISENMHLTVAGPEHLVLDLYRTALEGAR